MPYHCLRGSERGPWAILPAGDSSQGKLNMSDEAGVAVEKKGSAKKSGKRKASGAPRAPRVDLVAAEYGERGSVAAKAFFQVKTEERKAEKKELLNALRAKSKAADPVKIAKIQQRIADLTAKLNAANNSTEIIAKYKAKLQSIWATISGETATE